jgi:hypothetical protein
MRDYFAEAILGDDHLRRKTPYQRQRERNISNNERVYREGQKSMDDVRKFLETARMFMKPDVSPII